MNSCSYPPARSSSNWYNWYNSILNISNVIIEVVSDWSWIILNTRLIESLKVGKRYFEGQLVEKLSKIFLRSTCRILMTPLLLECLFSANKMKALILFLHSQKKNIYQILQLQKLLLRSFFRLTGLEPRDEIFQTRQSYWPWIQYSVLMCLLRHIFQLFGNCLWYWSGWGAPPPSPLPPHRYTTQWREQHRKEIYFNTTWEFSMRFPSICHPWVWGVRW